MPPSFVGVPERTFFMSAEADLNDVLGISATTVFGEKSADADAGKLR